ncbi:MAG: hypothetical protein K8U57_07385 [Planctomycetes bacterium]|nr:hypothetical protein [Planctomycetota bacterium]
MEFFNGSTLEAITDKDVDIYLRTNSPTIEALLMCRTFQRDGKLWVDFIPKLNHKYAAEIPEDAVVGRNEEELSVGRYGIFIRKDTPAGKLALALLEAKAKGSA